MKIRKVNNYMAMLRNLRGMLEAGISHKHVTKVSAALCDRESVIKSKQLPFRFLSALRSLKEMSGDCDVADLNELSAAIELASNEACANIPVLTGITAIFADNSASMNRTVSDKSTMTCRDASNVLCGIVAKVAERPYVFAFGTNCVPIRFTKNDTVLGIAEKVSVGKIGGMNTNGHKCVEWMIQNKLVPDRVIFLSDMQMWNDGSCSEGNICLADVWGKYRISSAKAKDTWLHSVHVNGYGDNVVKEGDKVNQVGGFSEKVFTMLLQAEGGVSNRAVPTIEQIRSKWSVK